MSDISFIPYTNYVRIVLGSKSVCLKGRQEDDVFQIFTEDFETTSSLNDTERNLIKKELQSRNNLGRLPLIIID